MAPSGSAPTSSPARRAPDPIILELGREAELLVAKVRVGIAAAAVATVLLFPPVEPRIFLAGYGAMLLAGLAILALARRATPLPGLGLASCLLDVTLVSLLHVALLLAGNPLLATNSRVFFNVYFLALSAACLRLDPRLCVAAGLTAIVQYGAIALWAAHALGLGSPALAHDPHGAFRWDNQVARLILLGIAAAIDTVLVQQGRKLWAASVHDRLTGLHNRGYAESRLGEALSLARRKGRIVVVALADLDGFKAVNDRHGHAAGDEALREAAGRLRRWFRASDVLARYGGEEFLIILPETAPNAALDRLEGFRESFAAAPVPLPPPAEPVALTLSAGAAAYPADGGTAADLLHRADERLYAAKQAGRDRVHGWRGAVPRGAGR